MERSPMLEHFAEELRLARSAASMSQTALAEAINYSQPMVAKVESCERRPSLDFARRCDTVFNTDGRFVRIQKRISREIVVQYFREWAGVEQEAKALRSFEPAYVPGLLQTEAYSRAVFSGPGLLSGEEIEEQVTTRLDRQEILARPKPPLLTFVLDEFVLRREIGDRTVMREQLLHLVKVGTTVPQVRIHVVPASVGSYAGLDGPFVLATPPAGEPAVYFEGHWHGHMDDRSDFVRHMIDIWETIRSVALPQQQSLDLIAEVAETWT
ncbi:MULTISPECIES: helix-turn-helix transcriptional regulator [unclassified Plantactinospora]|uniref:helix-turn-helix domain-containing protein n=1 Tax=unclassified Plantactinospora TaxID=2631981 RepID=UPI000D174C40|nr:MULTISPECIES: helix-turn-helix transcriptional regulator [unclassified Plantactinospora]AVT30329.1 XRE family transcriptional regulator [Plantactinospora sp. BC1]AVT37062.1 XRE family transcriptional regulator [Plantactinospora sp. BB1]